MTREEALGLESIVRYNLTATKHKEAVDVAFDALREQEKCAKSAHCTNADRIRAMSDEELAEMIILLSNCMGTNCSVCPLFTVACGDKGEILDWLKQPAREDAP